MEALLKEIRNFAAAVSETSDQVIDAVARDDLDMADQLLEAMQKCVGDVREILTQRATRK